MQHPLTAALIERFRNQPAALVLEIGTGSGRHLQAMEAAGLRVRTVADACIHTERPIGQFDAALSTHGLLHGTPDEIAATLAWAVRSVRGPLYLAFGSTADARYGAGRRLGEGCFAPESGEERGTPHSYFDRRALERLLASAGVRRPSIQEVSMDAIVGRWAHERALSGSTHWHVVGTAPSSCP